jgi:hypothetical protein
MDLQKKGVREMGQYMCVFWYLFLPMLGIKTVFEEAQVGGAYTRLIHAVYRCVKWLCREIK